jgi:hypothetical protein
LPAVAKIRHLLAEGLSFSFEFFPPKTDEAQRTLEKRHGPPHLRGPLA